MSRRVRQVGSDTDPRTLATRLHSAAIHLLRRLRVEDAATGLSAPRASAMSVIVFGGPVTLSELAKAEQVSVPTMSRLVSLLVRAGLVERGRDPDDRRAQRLRATAKGRALLEAGRARRVRVLTGDLERLPKAKLKTLAAALQMIERLARPAPSDPPDRHHRSRR